MAIAIPQEQNILAVPYVPGCTTPIPVHNCCLVAGSGCDSSPSRTLTHKPPSTPFESVIQVLVGSRKNPTTFYVHDALLIASSPFFRACMTHACQESVSGIINLPTDRADTFAFFLQWLYHQHGCSLANVPASQADHVLGDSLFLTEPRGSSPAAADGEEEGGTPPPRVAPRFFPLLRLYIFAFRYFLPAALKNAIVDRITQLADQYNSVPNIDDVRLLWEDLPPAAKLRDLVLDLFTWKRTERLLKEGEQDGWPAEFLWELCRRLKLKVPAGPPWRGLGGCCAAGYHEHEEGEDCSGGLKEGR